MTGALGSGYKLRPLEDDMRTRMERAAALGLAAALLAVAPPGHALEISARPSIEIGGEDLENDDLSARVHAGISLRSPEFGPGLSAELELSFLAEQTKTGLGLADNSSWLRLRWRPEPWSGREGVALTVMPLRSERIFLGYDYPAAALLPGQSQRALPGADLRLVRDWWHVFVALQSQSLLDEEQREEVQRYSVLAGGGVHLFGALEAGVMAGWADHGTNPRTSALGGSLSTGGVAGRLLWHRGPVVGSMVDFQRRRVDPSRWERLGQAEEYPGGVSATVVADVTYVQAQGLASADEFGATMSEGGVAAVLEGRLKWNALRVGLRGSLREARFLTARTLGLYPGMGLAAGTPSWSEVGAALSFDYRLPVLGLTPGLGVSMEFPAALDGFNGTGANNPNPNDLSQLLLTDQGWSLLPVGKNRQVTVTGQLTLRWDFEYLSAVGALQYQRDPNFWQSRNGLSKEFNWPTQTRLGVFGVHVLLQARF